MKGKNQCFENRLHPRPQDTENFRLQTFSFQQPDAGGSPRRIYYSYLLLIALYMSHVFERCLRCYKSVQDVIISVPIPG